jgi:hypothetical protein
MPSTEIELFWNATNLVRVVEAADRRLAILIDFCVVFFVANEQHRQAANDVVARVVTMRRQLLNRYSR